MMCDNARVPVTEAATRLGLAPQALRMGLRLDKFPFGTAWQAEGGRWVYYINRKRFEIYLQAIDLMIAANEGR